jgi:hypothetical protein
VIAPFLLGLVDSPLPTIPGNQAVGIRVAAARIPFEI